MIEIYTDGASRGNPGASASSFVFVKNGKVEMFSSFYIGISTNNVAEYKGIIFALEEAVRCGYSEVLLVSDSQLVISQINGTYKVKASHLKPLYEKVADLTRNFSKIEFVHSRRTNKFVKVADRLCNIMLDQNADDKVR